MILKRNCSSSCTFLGFQNVLEIFRNLDTFNGSDGKQCAPAWNGGCKDGYYLNILRKEDKEYSYEECYELCNNDPYCESFSVGTNGMERCVTYETGCTYLANNIEFINTD